VHVLFDCLAIDRLLWKTAVGAALQRRGFGAASAGGDVCASRGRRGAD
jgi:hypothetical protein